MFCFFTQKLRRWVGWVGFVECFRVVTEAPLLAGENNTRGTGMVGGGDILNPFHFVSWRVTQYMNVFGVSRIDCIVG